MEIDRGEGMPHKRRVRYKGTHPRKFEEKYKEHQPEKYKETVERVIQKGGTPAAQRLEKISQEELQGMLEENADEPYAAEIAQAVARAIRQGRKVDTTAKLREIICQSLSFLPEAEQKDAVKKSCAPVFQALRIDINQEYEALYAFMEKLPYVLAPGGRAAILTFHSGEDRLVKKALKQYRKQGLYSQVSEDVIRPSAEECVRNSRARSTKMRWAVRA